MGAPALNSGFLFTKLNEKLRGNATAQQRVVAHIRRKTGHVTLPSFHNNGATEDEKVAIYSECLKAVLTGNFNSLLTVEEEQAAPVSRGDLADEHSKPVERAVTIDVDASKPEPVTEAVTEPVTEPVTSNVTASGQPDLAAAIARAIEPMITPQSKLDEGRVAEIAKDVVTSALNGEMVAKLIKDAIGEAQRPQVIEFTLPESKETRLVAGATHWQLPQVVTWVAADVPLWLWGQAGGGKTHMARQIGEALGLEVTVISIDPTMTVGKLLGFRNLATGEFVEGFLFKPFKEGGLVLIDEIDTGDPGILAALNALLANGHYLFPNGETVTRHEKFRVIAGANTKGCGAVAGYTARNRLDPATLDRFAVIELQYDLELKMALATGRTKKPGMTWQKRSPANEDVCAQWVQYVQQVRCKVGNSVLVSPRASILGCKALRAGIMPDEVADALLFKLVTTDTKRSITNQVGVFNA